MTSTAVVCPEDARAISQKKARYGRYADTKQWDKFADEVCLPSVRAEFYYADGSLANFGWYRMAFSDNQSFAGFFNGFFRHKQSLHMLGPGEFEPGAEPDEVRSIFSLEDQIVIPPFGGWAELRGGGFYYETWKKVDGEWYLKELRMQRTYQKMTVLMFLSIISQYYLGIRLL